MNYTNAFLGRAGHAEPIVEGTYCFSFSVVRGKALDLHKVGDKHIFFGFNHPENDRLAFVYFILFFSYALKLLIVFCHVFFAWHRPSIRVISRHDLENNRGQGGSCPRHHIKCEGRRLTGRAAASGSKSL